VPKDCKLHLACWNGEVNPLDVFLAGNFEHWQSEQTKRNFQRQYVVALIDLPEKDKWLFAGVYKVLECSGSKNGNGCYQYKTEEVFSLREYVGRVIVGYSKAFRQSYPYIETVVDELKFIEIKPERIAVSEFPGFNNIWISHQVLKFIIEQEI
jgi:hypothetical protein